MPQKRRSKETVFPSKRQRRATSPTKDSETPAFCVNNSAITQTPGTSFFELPRELRDQIYHEALEIGATFVVSLPFTRGPPYQFRVEYGECPNKCHDKPKSKDITWLFTNKQIFHEGSEQFQRNATWTYHSLLGAVASDVFF
ncbi:hypothetical protein CC86DRAFT_377418 [Ophiobolus disseminans]|uniref:Uncharacterized protein n=1 Tax=Ophiobolus disseminans TaxID=1469910 RepID=A0A6A7AH14_9PLEO|nr:hypothetical protein CC86DRAFT_377418 [Ophiobolus disseminans]